MSPFYADPPFAIPDEAVAVTVDATTTLVTGGTLDWIGRAAIKRWTDDRIVLAYYRSTGHATNAGGIYIKFSDDDGATWTAENTTLTGAAVTNFPMNPSTVIAGEDAFEPWLYVAPSGDLILAMWRDDASVPTGLNGTYLARSSDGGDTWAASTGPLQFTGLTSTEADRTFITDQDVVLGSTIYAGARHYTEVTDEPEIMLVKSEDDGVTWEVVSRIVTDTEISGGGTNETSLTYIGVNRFLAMIRDQQDITTSYKRVSSDLGATWGTLEDVGSDVGIAARQRVYTRAFLKGEANWWQDPVLLMVGFVNQTPGSSTSRRNAVWVSRDRGATWDGPFYIDTTNDDGGYGDMFYDAANDQWVVVNYRGTLTAADLKQYRLTIDGV